MTTTPHDLLLAALNPPAGLSQEDYAAYLAALRDELPPVEDGEPDAEEHTEDEVNVFTQPAKIPRNRGRKR